MKVVGVIVCFLFCINLSAQPFVRVLRDKISIGEQTELIYQIKGDSLRKGIFPKKEKRIKCDLLGNKLSKTTYLEIIGVFNDTLIKKNKDVIWEGYYTITCWDSGTVVIPAVEFTIGKQTISFLPVRLQVTSPKIIEGKDVYDIRTYFASIPTKLSTFFKAYGLLILSVLIAILTIYFFIVRSRKKKQSFEQEIPLSLMESTLLRIDDLTNEKLWEQEKLKEHYVQLSLILRVYLGKRYGLSLMDKTSFQICILLSKCELHVSLQKEIQKVLDQSDLVKFAKSTPAESDIINISLLAKEIVKKTSPSNE